MSSGTSVTFKAGPGSGTDQTGGALTLAGGQGTGSGAGGSIIFQVADGSSSGTSANSLANALTLGDDKKATFKGNLFLGSDNSTFNFGLDNDVTLTHVPDTGLTLTGTTAATDGTKKLLDIIHQTSGTPEAGIGTDIAFTVETTAGNHEGMILEAVTTSVGAAAENFDFVVKLMASGSAAAEKFRVTSTGAVKFGGMTFPTSGGASGQVLQSDSSGNLSFSSAGTTLVGLTDVKMDASNFTDSLLIQTNSDGSEPTTGTLSSASNNIGIGKDVFSALTSGYGNIGIGNDVFKVLETGTSNIGIGNTVLDALLSGTSNTCIGNASGSAITTGGSNTCLGASTGAAITDGNYNTLIGSSTGTNITSSNNTAIGYQAGKSVSTGINNTIIGSGAAFTGTNDLTSGSNNTIIGYNAAASALSATNEITLGNGDITALRCADTTIASLSDQRDKTNITNSTYGLDFLNSLRPVQFTWQRRILDSSDENHSKNGQTRVGFLAQELQSAMSNNENDILDLVYDVNPDRIEAKYGNLIPILTKAIQELSAQNQALANRITALENA